MTVVIALLTVSGCNREERGPILAGGREVKSWVADLHDPKPQVRRQAVLKLGNVGDTDPAAAEGLAEALRDTDASRAPRRRACGRETEETERGDLGPAQVMSERDRDPLVRDYAKRAIAHFEQMT